MLELIHSCPHGMPWYHWIADMWYLALGIPVVVYGRYYCQCAWCKVKRWMQ